MNINELTFDDLTKTNNLFNSNKEKKYPIEMGRAYMFRTVTHIDLGRVTEIVGQFAKMEDASWIADTGYYSSCLKEGVEKQDYSEIEPYPHHTFVNMDALIDVTPWEHNLPRERK